MHHKGKASLPLTSRTTFSRLILHLISIKVMFEYTVNVAIFIKGISLNFVFLSGVISATAIRFLFKSHTDFNFMKEIFPKEEFIVKNSMFSANGQELEGNHLYIQLIYSLKTDLDHGQNSIVFTFSS